MENKKNISMEETEVLLIKLMKIILKNKTFPSPRNVALMARKLINHKNNVDSNPNNAPSGVDINEFKKLLFDPVVKEILYDIGKFDKSINFVFPEENLLDLAKIVVNEENN
jgi:hypothetical protein